jgi:DNA polymerase III gamma/tau subunit
VGQHLDVKIYNPQKSSYSIEDVREIAEQTWAEPQIGRTNFTAITQANLLAEESQNTLLKALEEPPLHSVIALFTPSLDRLLPTILSRSVQVNLFDPNFIGAATVTPASEFLLKLIQSGPTLYQLSTGLDRYLNLVQKATQSKSEQSTSAGNNPRQPDPGINSPDQPVPARNSADQPAPAESNSATYASAQNTSAQNNSAQNSSARSETAGVQNFYLADLDLIANVLHDRTFNSTVTSNAETPNFYSQTMQTYVKTLKDIQHSKFLIESNLPVKLVLENLLINIIIQPL